MIKEAISGGNVMVVKEKEGSERNNKTDERIETEGVTENKLDKGWL